MKGKADVVNSLDHIHAILYAKHSLIIKPQGNCSSLDSDKWSDNLSSLRYYKFSYFCCHPTHSSRAHLLSCLSLVMIGYNSSALCVGHWVLSIHPFNEQQTKISEKKPKKAHQLAAGRSEITYYLQVFTCLINMQICSNFSGKEVYFIQPWTWPCAVLKSR